MIVNEDASVIYLPDAKVAISTGRNRAGKVEGTPPTVPVQKPAASTGEVANWGDDNLFPQNLKAEVRSSTIIPSTLDKMARTLVAGGIEYGSFQDGGDKRVFRQEYDLEIEDWLDENNIDRYLIQSSVSFYWYMNLFPELILSKNRSKVASIALQQTPYCRWEKQDESGFIRNCYINANWDNGGAPSNSIKVPVINPYYGKYEQVRSGKSFKYIYPVSYPDPGNSYYALAYWDGARTSGWLDVSKAIPEFKKSLFKNQLSIKFHIEISTEWWKEKYHNWDDLGDKEKSDLKKAEAERIEKFFKGAEQAGNTLITPMLHDPMGGDKFESYWRINAIDDKIKDGIYVEDSQEASSHLLYALGMDPALTGSGPGKAMGAGSGSDKRVAFNVYVELCQPHERIILEPLNYIARYNGWTGENGRPIKFQLRHNMITTLDAGQEVKEPKERETTISEQG